MADCNTLFAEFNNLYLCDNVGSCMLSATMLAATCRDVTSQLDNVVQVTCIHHHVVELPRKRLLSSQRP